MQVPTQEEQSVYLGNDSVVRDLQTALPGGAGCAASLLPAQAPAVPQKLWLWKNFVDGKPEYWAFDNPYPINLDNGDPQTLGEPCGYALFKPSRTGRTDVSEERVLRAIASAAAHGIGEAMHASAPEGCGCADCAIDREACPRCYSAWWAKRHPNVEQLIGSASTSEPALAMDSYIVAKRWPDPGAGALTPELPVSEPAPQAVKHCQSLPHPNKDTCLASRRDGVLCAEGDCDIDDGVRQEAPQAEAVQAVEVLRELVAWKANALDHDLADAAWDRARSLASASDAAPTDSKLSEKDVFTIFGYIEHLRLLGQTDMPAWFSDLAERMALSIGEAALANKVAALRVRKESGK